jgi:carbamoyltransferase
MGLIFFTVVTPIAFLLRAFGKDVLNLKKNNKKYYKLIKKFKEKTNCPIIVNTSFNVRGEPIVNTPSDAFNCFMGTDLDKLVIGNCYLEKKSQNIFLKKDYKIEFELD